jgi:glutathione S-transferase
LYVQCLRPLWLSLWSDGDAQERFLRESLVLLDAHLVDGGKRFFGGDDLGFADVTACTLAHWLDALQEASGVRLVADGEFPALRRWAEEYTSHEVVKPLLPDRGRLVAFFAANKGRIASRVKAAVKMQ